MASSTPSPSSHRAVLDARRQYVWGTLMLLSVVFLWVSSSFIMNAMFTSMSYNKPFLITYLCTASFSAYLIRPTFQYLRSRRGKSGEVEEDDVVPALPELGGYARSVTRRKSVDRISTGLEPIGSYTDANGIVHMRPDFSYRARSHSRSMSRSRPPGAGPSVSRPISLISSDPPLTVRQTASLALLFCGLWFSANWSMNAALGYTSVSSTTILSSMSGFFTLAVGSCVGVESFTVSKLSSVVLSVIGVIVISKSDATSIPPTVDPSVPLPPSHSPTPSPSAPLLGDALALISALAYAFYVILLKVRIRTESRVSMTLFFGFVGLFNILLIWPLGFVLHFTGVEVWEWPSGGKLWLSIGINAMITFVSDALYLRAMLMTSPLAVTLGISLTIPLAMAGDLYRGTPIGWKTMLGGVLVLGSFVANGLMDLASAEEEISALVEEEERSEVAGERERLLVSETERDVGGCT